jgi:predicted TIM-barrel fold metal-dependent hydrolase
MFIDEIAVDFPTVPIILAHAGFCWWPEALNIAATKANIYLDLAGWQPRIKKTAIDEFYRPLRTMIDTIGSNRILLGSDWPALRLLMNSQQWVDSFKNPPDKVKEAV